MIKFSVTQTKRCKNTGKLEYNTGKVRELCKARKSGNTVSEGKSDVGFRWVLMKLNVLFNPSVDKVQRKFSPSRSLSLQCKRTFMFQNRDKAKSNAIYYCEKLGRYPDAVRLDRHLPYKHCERRQ